MTLPVYTVRHLSRAALSSAIALVVAACGRAEEATVTTDTAAARAKSTGPSASAPAVAPFVAVTERPLQGNVTVQGELVPYRAVDLHARVAGYVRTVRVDRGSRVRRGDVLVEMDAPELLQQRSEADARLAVSRQMAARLRAAAVTAGAVAPSELETVEAGVKADEARVNALRELTSYLTVRAPFDGVVATRNVHPGALVGPNSGDTGMMLRLEDHDRLRLVIAVPERYAGGSLLGRTSTFRVSAWPGERFSGRLTRASGAIDPRTRAMQVEMDVASAGKLTPGMFADVEWSVARRGSSLLVPQSALLQTGTRTYVVKLSGDTAALVDVERGVSDGDLVEVFGPLAPTDTVVRRASDEIVAGTRLRGVAR